VKNLFGFNRFSSFFRLSFIIRGDEQKQQNPPRVLAAYEFRGETFSPPLIYYPSHAFKLQDSHRHPH